MEFLDILVTALLASLPGLFIALWSWFKANAAQTEATWDDATVKFVEQIAGEVVAKSQETTTNG